LTAPCNCPETSVSTTDSLLVRFYKQLNSTGSLETVATFITKQLTQYVALETTTWTVHYVIVEQGSASGNPVWLAHTAGEAYIGMYPSKIENVGLRIQYEYYVYGPFWEKNATIANLTVEVTVVRTDTGNTSYFLNGTVNTLHLLLGTKPVCFIFEWTIEGTDYTRYYLVTEDAEDVYVFIPDTPTYVYTVIVKDYYGLSPEDTVSCLIYANGSQYVVEKKSLNVKSQPFTLNLGYNYIFKITTDTAQFTYSHIQPGTEDQIVFEVNVLHFSTTVETAMKNVKIEAGRSADGEKIWVAWNANTTLTEPATLTIKNYNNNTVVVNTEIPFPFINYTWNNADNETDYVVYVTLPTEDYGVITWSWSLPKPAVSQPVIDLSPLGSFPIDSGSALGMLLVLCLFACFSSLNREIGLLITILVALALGYIGFLSLNWTVASIALCLSIFYLISKFKREEEAFFT